MTIPLSTISLIEVQYGLSVSTTENAVLTVVRPTDKRLALRGKGTRAILECPGELHEEPRH